MKSKPSLTAALIFVALWLGITIAGGFLQGGGSATLDGLVQQGPLWGVWVALLFLGVGTLVFRWTGLGFRRPDWLDSLRLMWLPLLMIAGFLAAGMQGNVPPPTVIGWVFLNCLFVGISEEWAFRGILLKPFREKHPLLTAVIVTSVIFGLAHALNGFVTGNFGAALGQAVAAAMSGFLFTALRLRTRSLWPVMLLSVGFFNLFPECREQRRSAGHSGRTREMDRTDDPRPAEPPQRMLSPAREPEAVAHFG